jgi:hypothetical protein
MKGEEEETEKYASNFTYDELMKALREANQRAKEATQRAEQERMERMRAEVRAEKERVRAEKERVRAEKERMRADAIDLRSKREKFVTTTFNNSDHFLQLLVEAQFTAIRGEFINQIPRAGRPSENFATKVSSTNTSSSGKGLTGCTFKVNMLSNTTLAVEIKDLKFRDIEGVILREFFDDKCDAMELFLTEWCEILEDLRCAVLFYVNCVGVEYEVSQTQPLILRFIEGMIQSLGLAGSVAIDGTKIQTNLIVTESEFKSIMGERVNVLRNDSCEIQIPFTAKRDLIYSPLEGNRNPLYVHFEVKRTGGIEKGGGLGPREQVIATNIVWASADGASFVRGMAINVFAASLVWFINDSNGQRTTNGIHYVGSRVWKTRDVVLQILACLMDVSLDQITGMVEMESAELFVIDDDGELSLGFPNESVGWFSSSEEAVARGAAGGDSESKGTASGTNARHVTMTDDRMGGRSRCSASGLSAVAASVGDWRIPGRAEGTENKCPQQQDSRAPFLSAVELQKLGSRSIFA